MEHNLVYVTAGRRDEALAIAEALVDQQHVACATVLGGATSIFWWEGRRQQAEEAVLLAKTSSQNVGAVIEKVRELHSYSCR